MKRRIFFISLWVIVGLAACGSNDRKPVTGDILSLRLQYSLNDSLLFNSDDMGMPMYIELIEPDYPGDIYEKLSGMSVGDSISFYLDAENFFRYTAGVPALPDFIEKGSELLFTVKLLKAMNDEEFEQERQRLMEQQIQEDMQRSEMEEEQLLNFIAGEGIDIEPTASGLYYIETKRGDGPEVRSGDMVSVHYEGRLLDGIVFDSSYDRGQPLEFPVGEGWVIPGWDEGIRMMRVGGKATLIIPSYLGYGDRGAGPLIKPFSTLVFDVELVDVQKNK